jgi:hypothetical protein
MPFERYQEPPDHPVDSRCIILAESRRSGMTGRKIGGESGGFFAVDRRAWAVVCEYGINAATTYLVLARGSGPDQRTTSWSVRAVETHTGTSRPRAETAIAELVKVGLVRITRTGTRPQYYLAPAHEVPGCEACTRPPLDQEEKRVFDLLVADQHQAAKDADHQRHGPSDLWGSLWPCQIADRLVIKGYAIAGGDGRYTPIGYDAEPAAKPDWIWLPNALVDGAGENIAAPVELVRQTQSITAMRLFIDLYHAHRLAADGGIHWRTIRRETTRYIAGQRGSFTVYGFVEAGVEALPKAFVGPRPFGTTEKLDATVFWDAWNRLIRLGLLEFVNHVVEADTDEAEIIHPYAVGNGETEERLLAKAAHRAGERMLTEAQRRRAERRGGTSSRSGSTGPTFRWLASPGCGIGPRPAQLPFGSRTWPNGANWPRTSMN